MKIIPELDEGEIMAWDIYMFYDAEVKWVDEFPPLPQTHMYQLGGKESTLPHKIRGKDLEKALRVVMVEMTSAD